MKAIHVITQNIGGGNIAPAKQVGFVSVTWDNVKMTIDAYKDGANEPRKDCLVELATEDEVFELTAEQLLHIIQFYIDYAPKSDSVIHYRNRYHYIVPDDLKKAVTR
jgi:hypothetical protein